jgi:hypothetical protein
LFIKKLLSFDFALAQRFRRVTAIPDLSGGVSILRCEAAFGHTVLHLRILHSSILGQIGIAGRVIKVSCG